MIFRIRQRLSIRLSPGKPALATTAYGGSAFAQTTEYYVVQDTTTKKCTIVDQRPTTTKTCQEAEAGMKTIKVCESK